MDFEATVHLVLPVVKGQGARGEWTKQEVVFELILQEQQYSRKICVGFWNDKAPGAAALRVGDRVLVSVNIESRERNGRWFTEARGWKFTVLSPGQSAPVGYGGQSEYGAAAPTTYGGAAAAPAPQYGTPAPEYGAPAPTAAPVSAPSPAAADDLPF